ncbi:MAG TPA: acyl-ACP--UDP-N-acetylglucosamine O-acyltransferase [Candidatus Krumholzibacteria bacterium]|nr:acyl-ACP--UDP-N-acetylglucosamine O-acyltransferase [Candidatus Krumholzibacteria bacterium]HPD71695.1 acyl-ACP--UDP-N-acetylglucosamine O-acyltransferase [Candidatus Krumholzibacteria bacterium]HRY41372.1 acyl-ACP--UDP-N-acetylglucosamine O-acyltransferase [Candidatus Krumholzibacteria bacterium]
MEPIKFNRPAGPRPLRSAEIHPTAVVHPDARLGYNVQVEPHAVVGAAVQIGNGCVIGPSAVLDGHVSLGDDCHVGPSVMVTGHTTIGRGNRFFHGASIGNPPQDLKYQGEVTYLEIGDDNVFREYCTVHLAAGEGEKTKIGSNNLLMAYVHIAHNCVIQDRIVIANAVNIAGHVEVESWATIGGMTPVHQFVRIGAHSMIGGGSRLPQDVPPFVRVAGNPVEVCGINSIGLKRRNFSDDELLNIKKAYRLLYRSGLNVRQALERIASDCSLTKNIEDLMEFIRRSERGIVR